MLKDKNGYPIIDRTAYGSAMVIRCASNGSSEMSDFDNRSYDDASAAVDGGPLAYVYSPKQRFRLLYSAPEALSHGTLFEELYKPMEVYGRE